MTEIRYDVLAIGNAIVDVLADVDDAFLDDRSLEKGAMALIDAGRADALTTDVKARRVCSGGSAANTAVGIASFGGRTAFIGKVAPDTLGDLFREDIRKSSVAFDSIALEGGAPTARCIVLVTPDAQRTLQTYLGACAALGPEDVVADVVAASSVTYLEGYLFDPPAAKKAFSAAASIAHDHGRQVALSLSDAFCVDRHRDDFRRLVADSTDVLFANETEVTSLYETGDLDAAIAAAGRDCDLAAITLGARGAAIVAGGERHDVAAERVDTVVDTTGAGDLFAAGFLFGWTRGASPADCGRLGALAASEIIAHYGARPEGSLEALARDRGLYPG